MKIPKILLFPEDIDDIEFSKASSIVRIFISLILLHRFLDLFFASPLNYEEYYRSLFGVISSIFTLIGFLTPIFLPLQSMLNFKLATNLAGQIVSITTIILFLSHCWKYNSLDNLLRKRFSLISKLFKKVEIIFIRTFILRTFSIWLWGGICFHAMSFHFTDPSWINGSAVLTLLRTPYLNDYYPFFNRINDSLLLNLSRISLYGMAIWELLLWIIPGIKIIRNITFWWGIGFFITSILFINLSYLPYLEILMWLLIYKPKIFLLNKFLKNRKSSYKFIKKENDFKHNYFIQSFIIIFGFISILYMTITTTIATHGSTKKIRETAYKMHLHFIPNNTASMIYGQLMVNVFNQDDLGLNRYSILICRNNENGDKKLVPFQDSNGGRLSYLTNDNLYYERSLVFQRGSRNLEPKEFYDHYIGLSKDIISYDLLLNSGEKIISYTSYLLEHNPNYIKKNILSGWNKNKKARIRFSKTFNSKDIKSEKKFRVLIPPGHFNEKSRIIKSEKDFC